LCPLFGTGGTREIYLILAALRMPRSQAQRRRGLGALERLIEPAESDL